MRAPLRGRRLWLVGASEGLGRALAHEASRRGAHLVLSARSEDRLASLAAALPGPAEVVPCDVADPKSVAAAAGAAGPVDDVVTMAGLYWPMRARDWDARRVEAMLDVNLGGTARVVGAVLPDMLARGVGRLVLVGSLAGYRGLPGAISYGASKAGVASLAESLHVDLRGTGVRVQLVLPGFVRTRLTDRNDFDMPFLMEPDAAARRIADHMESARFRAVFPRRFGALFRSGRILPDGMWARAFGRD